MKTIKNVLSIHFKCKFKLHGGCVNYDSSEQKFILYKLGLLNEKVDNNVLFAKKNFSIIEDNDGKKNVFRYKISRECINKGLFKELYFYNQVHTLPNILYKNIAKPFYLLNGYLFASSQTLKRKSPIYMSDAEEEGAYHDTVILESFSRCGERDENSFFKKEQVNTNNLYVSSGGINLKELQFISCDTSNDRQAAIADNNIYLNSINTEYIEKLKDRYNDYIGEEIKCKAYSYISDIDDNGEYGILLPIHAVDFLIKNYFERFKTFEVIRNKSKLTFDSFEELYALTDNGRIDIDFDNINDYFFEYKQAYEEYDEETRKEIFKELDKYKEAEEAIKKAKIAEKKNREKAKKLDE